MSPGKRRVRGGAAGGTLPADAALNMIAQQSFANQGSGEAMAWKRPLNWVMPTDLRRRSASIERSRWRGEKGSRLEVTT